MTVDHHPTIYPFRAKIVRGVESNAQSLSKEEILDLAQAGDVRSPFSGNVIEISVDTGQEVMVGDRVAVMEAMKMQTPLLAEMAGIVTGIIAKKGDALQPGSKILKIGKDE